MLPCSLHSLPHVQVLDCQLAAKKERHQDGVCVSIHIWCRPVMQVLNCQLAAKKEGYADVVYLDAKSDTFLEEVSSCNIFTVKGNTVKTPTLQVRPAIYISSCLLQHTF